MFIQTKFKASVVNTFEKEFESKGQKVQYYNLGIMTEDGVDTLKCNKDVFEMVSSGKIPPMSKCEMLALYDNSRADFRVVAMRLDSPVK